MTRDESQNNEKFLKNISHRDNAVIIELTGDIDLSQSTELRGLLLETISQKPAALIIDFHHVEFLDSSGLATLIEALQICREKNIPLKLAALRSRVKSVFEIARLDSLFQIYDDQQKALA